MPRYQVTKTLRLQYDVEAATPEAALEVPWPKEDPQAVTIVRQRARDLDRPASAGRAAIADRELRPGRRFVARYKGHEWRAEVRADGQIEVQRKGSSHTETFSSLNKAAMYATGKKAINAWAWVHDAAPAA